MAANVWNRVACCITCVVQRWVRRCHGMMTMESLLNQFGLTWVVLNLRISDDGRM